MELYILTFPDKKRYVGVSKNFIKRAGPNGAWYSRSRVGEEIKKVGWQNVHKQILLTNLTEEEAFEREKFYIALFRTTDERFGFNRSIGGRIGTDKGKNSGSKEYGREYDRRPERKAYHKAKQQEWNQKFEEEHGMSYYKWRKLNR